MPQAVNVWYKTIVMFVALVIFFSVTELVNTPDNGYVDLTPSLSVETSFTFIWFTMPGYSIMCSVLVGVLTK